MTVYMRYFNSRFFNFFYLKYKIFFNRSCVAGRTTFTVSAKGDIRPCSHSDEIYGNILDVSVSDAIGCMTKWRDNSLIPNNCSGCANEVDCRGGCRVSAKAFSDELDGAHPYQYSPTPIQVKLMSKNRLAETEYLLPKAVSIADGKFRYRHERNDFWTVFLNSNSFSTLSGFEFDILNLLHSYRKINYSELVLKLDVGSNLLASIIRKFENSRLIKRVDQ